MLGEVIGFDLELDPTVVGQTSDREGADGDESVDPLLAVLVRGPVLPMKFQSLHQRPIEPFLVLAYEAMKKVDRLVEDVLQQIGRVIVAASGYDPSIAATNFSTRPGRLSQYVCSASTQW